MRICIYTTASKCCNNRSTFHTSVCSMDTIKISILHQFLVGFLSFWHTGWETCHWGVTNSYCSCWTWHGNRETWWCFFWAVPIFLRKMSTRVLLCACSWFSWTSSNFVQYICCIVGLVPSPFPFHLACPLSDSIHQHVLRANLVQRLPIYRWWDQYSNSQGLKVCALTIATWDC